LEELAGLLLGLAGVSSRSVVSPLSAVPFLGLAALAGLLLPPPERLVLAGLSLLELEDLLLRVRVVVGSSSSSSSSAAGFVRGLVL
jgi:hypothetical protein